VHQDAVVGERRPSEVVLGPRLWIDTTIEKRGMKRHSGRISRTVLVTSRTWIRRLDSRVFQLAISLQQLPLIEMGSGR
jgi:hypothetical protein